jgi:hypothetical protein
MILREEKRELSSQASPVVLRDKGKHAPSAGTVLAVLVTLLILFHWMHFILAQRIESAGREIQVKTGELRRLERQNGELRRQISIAASQDRMARRSSNMGYTVQRPVYLLVDQPLPPTSKGSQLTGQELARTIEDGTLAAFGWPVIGPGLEGHGGE